MFSEALAMALRLRSSALVHATAALGKLFMSLSDLFGVLQRYANPGNANTGNVEHDYDHVAQNASQSQLSNGLAGAFRSDQTPAFGQMLGTLFSNSNGQQRAGILNQLAGALGPAAAGSILGKFTGGSTQVTPEQAQQVPPEAVTQLAEQAHRNDPSILEQASNFYAQHPTLIKALGAGSLAMIMSHMSKQS
jgi:hypothetical protein